MSVRLVQCTAAQLIEALPHECVQLVLADPPWSYTGAGPPRHGRADDHYQAMRVDAIVDDLEAVQGACKPQAWMVLWITIPLVDELFRETNSREFPWQYVTGGIWHKVTNKRSIGHHVLGEVEFWTLWRLSGQAVTHVLAGNLHQSARLGHSQKPPELTMRHIRAWSSHRDLVLDPYAGEYGAFAKVCLREGRRYLGAEPDPARFDRAEKILNHFKEIHEP